MQFENPINEESMDRVIRDPREDNGWTTINNDKFLSENSQDSMHDPKELSSLKIKQQESSATNTKN